MVFPDVMKLTSSVLRSALCAEEGKKLVCADLSNIEGRYLAWAAGEEWKLEAFRAFDTFLLDEHGNRIPDNDDYKRAGPDLYKLAYARAFKMEADGVSKPQRQIGKVMELGLGFAGGVGAFLTFASAYDLDLEDLTAVAYDTLPEDVIKEADEFYTWMLKQKRGTHGLPQQVFVVCDSFKRLWRRAHPMTVALWEGLEDICRTAIQNPNETFAYRLFKARRTGQWLRLQMPSGRSLCYPYPQVDERGGISFRGMNQYTRKWERIKTFGGKLAENITQAGARDVFKHGTLLADQAGYPLVFPVHDENVTEVPDTPEYSAEELSRLMSIVPDWATGLPLAAEGFECYRYRK